MPCQLRRGLRAARAFIAGEDVLTCPRDLLWSAAAARSDPVLAPLLRAAPVAAALGADADDDATLAVFLLFVKLSPACSLPPASPRRTHVATGIPRSYSASVFFGDSALRLCEGSSLYALTPIATDYARVAAALFSPNPEVFPPERFTLEEYTWALFTVWSRAMDFQVESSGTNLRVIAPYLDMANHSFSVPQCHAYDPSTGSVKIISGKDYRKGDQIFINYGPAGNSKLLRLYGFVVPENPYDTYDLVLYTDPSAPLYDKKSTLFERAGLNAHVTIPLSLSQPLPDQVLQYLRIQRMGPDDIHAALGSQPPATKRLSVSGERVILSVLEESFSGTLAEFAYSADALVAMLENKVHAPGTDAYGAITVALSEQRILQASLVKVKSLLKLLECASCGKVVDSVKV
ncbi:hypothetical protein HK405_003251, partial [Cladochytrium tenue]